MRVKTGVKGLDDLIQGGLPAGSAVVLESPSGIEKDCFASEFVMEGLRDGEAVLVVLSSKPPTALFEELREKGFDPIELYGEGRLSVVDWYSQRQESVADVEDAGLVVKASADLLNVGIAITKAISALAQDKTKRAMIEMLSPALSAYQISQVHGFVQSTKAKLDRQNVTSIFLVDKEMHDSATLSTLVRPFDGVIDIDRVREGDRIVRKLAVLSLRGSSVRTNYLPFEVTDGGEIILGRSEEVAPKPIQKPSRVFRIMERSESHLKDNPEDADALFAKATALAVLQRYDESMSTLNELTRVDHRYPGLWLLKSKIYSGMGDEQKAKLCRERSAETEEEIDAEEEALLRMSEPTCPICGAPFKRGMESCPSCGVSLETEAPVKKPAPAPPAEPERRREPEISKIAPVRPRKRIIPKGAAVGSPTGRTNGLTNGLRGRTNGLARSTGKVNGLGRPAGKVNGLGRTASAGMVNGTGRTNGLVNGLLKARMGMTNGLTNGSGFTNGLGGHRFSRETQVNRWKPLLIPMVFVVLLITPLLNSVGPAHSGPAIDGNFDDWAGVSGVALQTSAGDPNIDLTRVALVNTTEALSLLVEVRGQILAGGPAPENLMDAVLVFVDTDGRETSGYPIQGIGADRLLRIDGRGGVAYRAVAYHASQSIADRRDWRIWTNPASIAAAANGNRLELAVDWILLGQTAGSPVFLVATLGWNGAVDFADAHVGVRPGVLRVTERHIQSEVLSGANISLLAVDLDAIDAPVLVSGITIELNGTAPMSALSMAQLVDSSGTSIAQRVAFGRIIAFTFPAITINPRAPQTWALRVTVSGTGGETLGAGVSSPSSVAAGTAVVTLRNTASSESFGYLGQVPAGPVIDGAFSDWTGETMDGVGEATTLGNPSIDIDRFHGVFGASDLTFHVALRGPAFAGTVLTTHPVGAPNTTAPLPDRDRDGVPDALDPMPDDFNNDGNPDALSGGDVDGDGLRDFTYGGPDTWLNTTIPMTFPLPYAGRNVSVYIGLTTLPPAIGEDTLRLYVDADNVTATGFYVGGIGADYLVEMRGREGAVRQATLSSHSGVGPYDWNWTTVPGVMSAVGLRQVEARVSLTPLVPSPPMYLETSAWDGGMDTLGPSTRDAGTRSVPIFTGPEVAFVPSSGGEFAYRSTGARLEAYARGSRGAGEELVLRDGSLFLGWRTERLGGTTPEVASAQAAGRDLVYGGFADAWEEYEISEDRVKHNLWLESASPTDGDTLALQGTLRIPSGAIVIADNVPVAGPFTTDGAIVIEYDGYRVRLQAPYAYESRHPETQVAGRFEGVVGEGSVSISMTVPASWLRDPARAYPVILDPTGIIDTSNPATGLPTHGPYARNVVYDGTNFWAFYYDGTAIRYEPSSDGLSWVNPKNYFFTTASIARVSVWFHDTGTTKIIYAVGDSTSTSKTVAVQRGTISGTTITWAGADSTVTVSVAAETKRAFITRDSGGYLWIASSSKDGGLNWNFTATRSTNTDDITAWGAYPGLLPAPIANNNIQGEILPLGSGEVYALWYADGSIGGRKYSGSWGSVESIDTTSAANLALAPSAVVDSSNYVNLVYVDSAGAVKYRQRTTSWSSATTLDSGSGNTFPTISLVTGTGNLYAFWISSTNQMKAKVYSGGSWTDAALETNTKAKTRLTSSYSVSSTASLGWIWTQGSAAPYDVKFSVWTTSIVSRTIDTSTEATPVSYNHQRKVFYDGTYFWAFYFDGTNSVYTYSSDASTWENTVSSAFVTYNGDNPSVWYYSGTEKIVYLVGDESSGDKDVMVRRGTISGTTITWTQDSTAKVSDTNLGSKVAFITRDSGGYLWIASSSAPTSSTYTAVAVKSTNTDDVTKWDAHTALIGTSLSVNRIYPTILPLASGDMYAFWYAEGAIAGKKYTASTTTWGSAEGIASTTSGVSSKIPSGVVDASYNVNLVFIDSTGQVVYRQRTTSWGSNTTLDSSAGSTSPTITLESGTGNLYVYYISSTGQIKAQKHATSWAANTTGIDTSTIAKTYLTSVYSVSGAQKIIWEWDQGGSSPYEVKCATSVIPEFQDTVVLVAGVGVFLPAMGRWRKERRRATSNWDVPRQ